jgi:hypothetical protein
MLNKQTIEQIKAGDIEKPVFTVMDKLEIYNDHTCPGIYYVETKNYFPMRGNGWYYNNMIDYALENNIITKNDIKLFYTPLLIRV